MKAIASYILHWSHDNQSYAEPRHYSIGGRPRTCTTGNCVLIGLQAMVGPGGGRFGSIPGARMEAWSPIKTQSVGRRLNIAGARHRGKGRRLSVKQTGAYSYGRFSAFNKIERDCVSGRFKKGMVERHDRCLEDTVCQGRKGERGG